LKLPTDPSANGGFLGSREYGVVSSDWGPGYLWAAAEKTLAERAKQPTPLANIAGAFAIFMMDNNAPNPFAGNRLFGVPNDAQGDWRLVDVLSSADAFPYDTYYDRPSTDEQAESHGFGTEGLGPLEKKYVEKNLGGKASAEKLLDEVIEFGGALLEELVHLDNENNNSLEDVIGRAGTHVSMAGREIVAELLQNNRKDPFILRVPIRAYAALNALKEQRDATPRFSSARRQFNNAVAAQRAHTHSELLQSLTHFRLAQLSNVIMDSSEQQQPFRFFTTLIDELDINYARLLSRINSGGMAEACQQIANAYGKLTLKSGGTLLQIKSFDPNVSLLKTVDRLRGGNGAITGEIVYGSNALKALAPDGSSPAQMVASLYAPTELRVDGIAARFYSVVHKNGALQQGREFLVVDLMKAPAIILQWIYKNGHFSKNPGSPSPPKAYLNEILRSTTTEHFNMLVKSNDAGKVVLDGIMTPGHGIQFVRTPTGSIEDDPTTMVPAETIDKDSKAKGRFIVGSSGGRRAEGSTPVAGVMLLPARYGLKTCVRYSPDGPSDGAVTSTAMPHAALAHGLKGMIPGFGEGKK
jgi:hypothetical protein